MLLASVVTGRIVESPPCFDFQPRESSYQAVDLVYCCDDDNNNARREKQLETMTPEVLHCPVHSKTHQELGITIDLSPEHTQTI